MRFDRESWRKLYVAESAEHRLLPLFTRGLRDYLLRSARDDGTILSSTKNATADLARALSVEPSERKQLDAAIKNLLAIGYLTLQDGRLWITRFEDAQAARSPGAKRQAAYMARKAGGGGEGASAVTSPKASPGDVSDDAADDVTKRREETTRDETTAPKAPARDDGLPPRPLAPPDLLAAPIAAKDWQIPASLQRYAAECGLSQRQFDDVVADLREKVRRPGAASWLFSQLCRFIEQRASKNTARSGPAPTVPADPYVNPPGEAPDQRALREAGL